MDRTVKQRILGCLKGIATGDAIGKQTLQRAPHPQSFVARVTAGIVLGGMW